MNVCSSYYFEVHVGEEGGKRKKTLGEYLRYKTEVQTFSVLKYPATFKAIQYCRLRLPFAFLRCHIKRTCELIT